MFHHGKICFSLVQQRVSLVPFLLVVLGGSLVTSCRSGVTAQGAVEVEVRQVGFDHLSNSPVVILQDKKGKRTMPIWIGISEARAIALQLQGTMPPRPLTHDLVKSILEEVGVEIDRVLVSDLKGNTYYARIHLVDGKKGLEVDSRPSDAIALALRFHRPIFVNRVLFESSLVSKEKKSAITERHAKQRMGEKLFGLTVQDLTDDLAKYFDLPTPEGILVTDVEGKEGTARLQRGDIIVGVNGEKVRDISELQQKIANTQEKVFTLLIRRDGEEISRPLSVGENMGGAKEETQ